MKFKSIISILFAGALLSSCHGDLDIVQKSEVSAGSMWKTQDDAISAMYGLYNQFRSSFSSGYVYWGEYRTGLWGDGLAGTASNAEVFQNVISTNHHMADWTELYTTINTANLILKYAPNIAFISETEKNKVLANALYVRAFCYYWIGRIWGDAPLLLDGFESDSQEGLYPTRQPLSEVFAQVNADIEQALSLIPKSFDSKTLATEASLNMLKADFSLWNYKVCHGGNDLLDKADRALKTVLNNSSYSLEEDFANIFKNEKGSEIIFAWPYIQDEFTGGYPSDYLVPNQYVSNDVIEAPVKIGSHQQWVFYTEDYKKILSENKNDQRTIVSFETFFDEKKNATHQWINKLSGSWTNGTRVFDSDIVVYRLADAYLLAAEVQMEKGNIPEAVKYLNVIAKRAYGVDNFYPTSMSRADLVENIVKERQKEFAAEGKLWWDYIRLGVVFDKVPFLAGKENVKNILLWPISQNSINKNPNLVQTEGYDK